MAYNTKIHLTDDKVCQSSGELLTLSGNTVIDATVGTLNYSQEPTWTGDTQIATKKYVDDNVVSGATYSLASPATTDVGGITAGTVLTGKSSNEILSEILTPYQTPTFSSFGTGISTPVEVGTVLSGTQSFNWIFTNGTNVQANTMCIYDVTDASIIATNISTTSPQSATINTVTFTTCGQLQQYKGCAQNSCSVAFGSSNTTITGLYPYFWGTCTCPGAAGANRPSLTAGDITGGTKVLAGSAGSFAINFASGENDYLWFAVPATVANKSCWVIDAINNGAIGGGVGAGCNLFPDPDVVNNVENECWDSVAYEVYVSNKQTETPGSMTIS
jgi:hypothetical protein